MANHTLRTTNLMVCVLCRCSFSRCLADTHNRISSFEHLLAKLTSARLVYRSCALELRRPQEVCALPHRVSNRFVLHVLVRGEFLSKLLCAWLFQHLLCDASVQPCSPASGVPSRSSACTSSPCSTPFDRFLHLPLQCLTFFNAHGSFLFSSFLSYWCVARYLLLAAFS